MDALCRVAPSRNPKLSFLKGKVTKRKREKVLYFSKYESQPDSSIYSKNLTEHQIIQVLGKKQTVHLNEVTEAINGGKGSLQRRG